MFTCHRRNHQVSALDPIQRVLTQACSDILTLHLLSLVEMPELSYVEIRHMEFLNVT